jgi:hypothetical protein
MLAALSFCTFGLLNGMRHALEPDHVAAVTSMVCGEKSTGRTVRFATLWGLGHALMLLVVGGALHALRFELPERVGSAFELLVAFVLVGLGLRSLLQVRSQVRDQVRGAAANGGTPSKHVHARLPFAVGLVHGLAGSGAMAAFAAAHASSAHVGLFFIALYAGGAVLGMATLAGLAGWPLARAAKRAGFARGLVLASGLGSAILGVVWGFTAASALIA